MGEGGRGVDPPPCASVSQALCPQPAPNTHKRRPSATPWPPPHSSQRTIGTGTPATVPPLPPAPHRLLRSPASASPPSPQAPCCASHTGPPRPSHGQPGLLSACVRAHARMHARACACRHTYTHAFCISPCAAHQMKNKSASDAATAAPSRAAQHYPADGAVGRRGMQKCHAGAPPPHPTSTTTTAPTSSHNHPGSAHNARAPAPGRPRAPLPLLLHLLEHLPQPLRHGAQGGPLQGGLVPAGRNHGPHVVPGIQVGFGGRNGGRGEGQERGGEDRASLRKSARLRAAGCAVLHGTAPSARVPRARARVQQARV